MDSKFMVQKHYVEKIIALEREREITGLRVNTLSLRIGREKSSMAKKNRKKEKKRCL